MQTNVREKIVVWIITQDDFKEECDSQVEESDSQVEEIGSDDDWSSNTYAFKLSEGYNITFMYYWTSCYFVDLLIFSFLLHYSLISIEQLWICTCYLNGEFFMRCMFVIYILFYLLSCNSYVSFLTKLFCRN